MQRLLSYISCAVLGFCFLATTATPAQATVQTATASTLSSALMGNISLSRSVVTDSLFGVLLPKPGKGTKENEADKWNDKHSIDRPDKSLAAGWKILLILFIYLSWIKTTDWVNRDCQIHNLGYAKWNAVAVFPVALAMLTVFLLIFPIGIAILALVYFALFITYLVIHNQSVPDHQKVLTKAWWRYVFASTANKLGAKIAVERVPEYEKGPKVDLQAKGAESAQVDQGNLIRARQSPGYVFLKEQIVDMLGKQSDKLMLDYTSQAVAVRYHIDGVWHAGEPKEREPADVMLAVTKTLANLDIEDRQKKQQGEFGAAYEGHVYNIRIESQGTKTGERVILSLDEAKHPFATLDELGIRDTTRDLWLEQLGADRGFVIMATMPGGGLTTLIDLSIHDTDRLMRDWVAIEEVHHPERDLENVERITYDATKGETPATILPAVIRKYPNVYVVRDLVNAESTKLLFPEVRDDRLVITSTRSKDASEAFLRILAMKVSQKEFGALVTAVLYERLIRKLCQHCKVGYEPTADVLQKLGIPAGRVQMLYRTPKPEERDKPCEHCNGLGFRGRTGIFELLVVNDEMREILIKQPKLDLIRRAARAAGMRSLQEEGILLVAKGITSLPELMRVLKM